MIILVFGWQFFRCSYTRHELQRRIFKNPRPSTTPKLLTGYTIPRTITIFWNAVPRFYCRIFVDNLAVKHIFTYARRVSRSVDHALVVVSDQIDPPSNRNYTSIVPEEQSCQFLSAKSDPSLISVIPCLPSKLLTWQDYRLGLSGLLNPPTRFMYCLYSVFFSFRTAYTSFPGTFVFFVVLNPAKPIMARICAISGSESSS